MAVVQEEPPSQWNRALKMVLKVKPTAIAEDRPAASRPISPTTRAQEPSTGSRDLVKVRAPLTEVPVPYSTVPLVIRIEAVMIIPIMMLKRMSKRASGSSSMEAYLP